MKKINLKIAIFIALSAIVSFSCKKDDEKNYITVYRDIMIGDDENTTYGHFLKPQTGEVIAVENTSSQEKYLALMFFTEGSGTNSFLTFPGNGEEASTFGTSEIRTFTQNPGGINYWPQTDLNTGMIYKIDMTATDFEELASSGDWTQFNSTFALKNNNKENLEYKLHYDLSPESGTFYLIQFNGLVRAIIYIKNVVTSGVNGGSIKMDMIIETREIYRENSSSEYIQPLRLEL